jgi:hypothetical protein
VAKTETGRLVVSYLRGRCLLALGLAARRRLPLPAGPVAGVHRDVKGRRRLLGQERLAAGRAGELSAAAREARELVGRAADRHAVARRRRRHADAEPARQLLHQDGLVGSSNGVRRRRHERARRGVVLPLGARERTFGQRPRQLVEGGPQETVVRHRRRSLAETEGVAGAASSSSAQGMSARGRVRACRHEDGGGGKCASWCGISGRFRGAFHFHPLVRYVCPEKERAG